jgi:hypothetical protein
MLGRSQTKVIFPVITLGLLRRYAANGQFIFTDAEIRSAYEASVEDMKKYLGHNLHIGGKYYDAYPSRNLPKYGVLAVLGNNRYELQNPYLNDVTELCKWIPLRIKEHIENKMGNIPLLGDLSYRIHIAQSATSFVDIITGNIDINPANFEIISFAVLKIHLEKFACKIYRDTKTNAYDKGVDISTNYGVVYQIKKLKIHKIHAAINLYTELKSNFDADRIKDGNVVVVIDDISTDVKQYLVNMKIQPINKTEITTLAKSFIDPEDREKVLRIIFDEFRREYSSNIYYSDNSRVDNSP